MSAQLHYSHPQVTVSDYCLPIESLGISLYGSQLLLPDQESSLYYFPWPAEVPLPVFESGSNYQTIGRGAMVLTQPRLTLCYGVAYHYSQKTHALSPTPADVQYLMDVTRSIYDPAFTLPVEMMCLANRYATGHHYINLHSDKEYQASNDVRDIICWCTGATRRVVIKTVKTPTSAPVKMIEISVPQGIYIMSGFNFQSHYTHEIPQEQETLFKKLIAILPPELATADKLTQADWLAVNPAWVQTYLPSRYEDYLTWSQERCSFTIRFFADAEERRRRGRP
jgi:hypothetical protein